MENNDYKHITKKISSLEKQCDDIEKECLKNKEPWDNYVSKTRDIKNEIFILDKKARFIQSPGLEGEKQWRAKCVSIDEFKRMTEEDEIEEDSNRCYYSNGMLKTDIRIYPSDVLYGLVRDDFTNVLIMEDNSI